jgi:DNA ligase-1
MKFSQLAKYLEELEKTSSRNKLTAILSELFQETGKEEIDKVVYLLLGRLAPAYENVVFNLAERMMLKVLAQAYQKDVAVVRKIYKEKGDLGIVAEELTKGKGGDLSVTQVYERLRAIAQYEGSGSQEKKINETARLLAQLSPLGARYVARIPVGRLRLGFSDKTIIDALSWMKTGDKSLSKKIEANYQILPDVGRLAEEIKKHGVLKRVSRKVGVQVGIPVLPMLAQRLKSPQEMIAKMGRVAVEPKFDGLRVLIHYNASLPADRRVKAFTRNLNEISNMFPELKRLGKFLKAKEAILDSEAVGLDPKTRKLVEFQKTMQRRRKHGIAESAQGIPLKFQVFDLLYKNGQSFLDETYIRRREELRKTISPNNLFIIDKYVLTDDPKVINQEYQKQVKMGLEGVMVKKAESHYVPGRTGWRWVKMKEAEGASGKLADTVDAVVMGYTRGKGKRTQFGLGQFLAGVVDKSAGWQIKTLTKVGTGLTDEQFQGLSKRLLKLKVAEKPKEYLVHKDLFPDFWVTPEVVVELAADELTHSPKHTAGLALRFPRLVKFRDDKTPAQATTLTEIKKLFKLQKS